MLKKATIPNLLEAIKAEDRKISLRPNFIPPKYLSFLKSEIGAINRSINIVEMVEILDSEKIKQRWLECALAGHFANPEFRYDEKKLKDAADKEAKVLELFDLVHDYSPNDLREQFEVEMLLHTLQNLLLNIEVAKSMLLHDDKMTARLVRKKFGEVPHITNNLSFQKDPSGIKLKNRTFNAVGIADAFDLAQGEYGFTWPIIISDAAVAIDVRDKSTDGKQIVIPKNREVDAYQLLRLIGHEIESHQRTSMNGLTLFGFGGLSMKTDNEELYEGLALLSDRDFDLWKNGKYQNETATYYVQAIRMALDGMSFAEVARSLWQLRSHEERALQKAYNMARRVFRGVTDTKNPAGYAFTKDLAYYNGLNQAIELESQGFGWLLELGSFDLNQLMIIAKYFRLSSEEIPYQKRIDLKNNPEFLELIGII